MPGDWKDPLTLLISFDLDGDPEYCFKHVLLLFSLCC